MSVWRFTLLAWVGLSLVLMLLFLLTRTEPFWALLGLDAGVYINPFKLGGLLAAPIALLVFLVAQQRRQGEARDRKYLAALSEKALPEGVIRFRYGTSRFWPGFVLCALFPIQMKLGNSLYTVWQFGVLGDLWFVLLSVQLLLLALSWRFLGFLQIAIDGGQIVTLTSDTIELPREAWKKQQLRLKLATLTTACIVEGRWMRKIELSDGDCCVVLPGWLMPRRDFERLDMLIWARANKAASLSCMPGPKRAPCHREWL